MGPRGNNATCSALVWLSVTSPDTQKQIGPFWCWFPDGGGRCVHSRTLWFSLMNSPVRLEVSPTTATHTGYCQRFWGFLFPHWNLGLRGLSHSPVVPPDLSALKCGTTSCHLASPVCQAPPCHVSSPLLPVLMNISSLTPWLSDFHTVGFSGSSGCFLFLNVLLSFSWLYKETKSIYLCLHLGWKFYWSFFSIQIICLWGVIVAVINIHWQ